MPVSGFKVGDRVKVKQWPDWTGVVVEVRADFRGRAGFTTPMVTVRLDNGRTSAFEEPELERVSGE